MPLPKLIEPPQQIQFICIGQCTWWGEAHEKVIPQGRAAAQSGARWICLSVKILWQRHAHRPSRVHVRRNDSDLTLVIVRFLSFPRAVACQAVALCEGLEGSPIPRRK